MASLRDFIASRRRDIRLQIEQLQAELSQLDVAESALDLLPPDDSPLGSASPMTFKGMAISILRRHPQGLAASDLLKEIDGQFGYKIMRSSLSPQLSRLGHEGILVRDGRIWRRTGATDKEARYVPAP